MDDDARSPPLPHTGRGSTGEPAAEAPESRPREHRRAGRVLYARALQAEEHVAAAQIAEIIETDKKLAWSLSQGSCSPALPTVSLLSPRRIPAPLRAPLYYAITCLRPWPRLVHRTWDGRPVTRRVRFARKRTRPRLLRVPTQSRPIRDRLSGWS